MANMKVKPWQWKKTSLGRVAKSKDESSRIGQVEALESRQMLSAFHPLEAKFQWAEPGRGRSSTTTEVRYDETGNFLGATGPEAGLHPNGLLGGGSKDSNQILVTFSGTINKKSLSPSDITITGDFDPTDPFRVTSVKAKKTSLTIRTAGKFSTADGSELLFQINNIQAARPRGVWMDPWSITADITTADECTSNCEPNTPPRIVSIDPAPNATLGQAPMVVVARFSEDLQAASVTSASFKLVSSGSVTLTPSGVTYNATTDEAQLSFANPLVNDTYQVILLGTGGAPIRDLQGGALDGNGNGIGGDDFSSTFQVNVVPGNTPPTVIALTPAANATLTGSPSVVEATFSEEVLAATATSAANFQLIRDSDGATIPSTRIDYFSNPPRAQFVVNGTLANGPYTIRLSGSIQDLGGAGLDGDGNGVGGDGFTSTFRVAADTTAPTVVGISPAANVVLTQTPPTFVDVQFSEDIQASSVTNASNFTLTRSGGDGGFTNGNEVAIPASSIQYDAVNRSARFLISGTLPNDEYLVRLRGPGGVQDLAGNALDGDPNVAGSNDYASVFQVNVPPAPDFDPPTIASITPAEQKVLATPPNQIVVTFSESLNASTVNTSNFSLFARGTDATFSRLVPTTLSYDLATKTVTVVPSEPLAEDIHLFRIEAAVTDEAGNRLDGNGDGQGNDAYVSTFAISSTAALVGGDPPDLFGDTTAADGFGRVPATAVAHDIASVGVVSDLFNAYFRATFFGDIQPASRNLRNSLFGFYDIDSDQNVATGAPSGAAAGDTSQQDTFGEQIAGTSTHLLGDEFYIDLGSEAAHPGVVNVVGTAAGTWQLDLDGGRTISTGETPPFVFQPIGTQVFLGDWSGDGRDLLGSLHVSTESVRSHRIYLDRDGNRRYDPNEDLDGDGVLDVAEIDTNANGFPDPAEDIDGDGKFDRNEDRDADGFLDNDGPFTFGNPADFPSPVVFVGDTDGNGSDNLVLFDPTTARFLIDVDEDPDEFDAGDFRDSPSDVLTTTFAAAGDIPFLADFDGDGRAEIAVFRAGSGFIVDADNDFAVSAGDVTMSDFVTEDLNANGVFNNGLIAPRLNEVTDDKDYNNDGDRLDTTVTEDLNGNGLFNNGVSAPLLNELADGQDYNNDGDMIGFAPPGGVIAGDVPVIGDWDGFFEIDFNGNGSEDQNRDGLFNNGIAAPRLDETNGTADLSDDVDYNNDGDKLDTAVSEDRNGDGLFNNGIAASLLADPSEDINGNGVIDGKTVDIGWFRTSTSELFLNRNAGATGGFTRLHSSQTFEPSEDTDGDGILAVSEDLDNDGVLDLNDGPLPFPKFDALIADAGASDIILGQQDFNGDGKDEVGFYRPSTGQFFIDQSGDGRFQATTEGPFLFGAPPSGAFPADVPVAGDLDGDGDSDIGVFRRRGDVTVGLAPIFYRNRSFTIKTPLGLIGETPVQTGPDADFLNFGLVVGTGPVFASMTDEAPNIGALPPEGPPPLASGPLTPVNIVAARTNLGPLVFTPPDPPTFTSLPPVGTGIGYPTTLIVDLSGAVDPTTVDLTTVQLFRTGGDGIFGNSNDIQVFPTSVTVSDGPGSGDTNDQINIVLPTVPPIPGDDYRLVLRGDDPIRDVNGVPIDGEFATFTFPSGNGSAEGDFVMPFRIDRPPSITSVRLTKPSDRGVAEVSDTGVLDDGSTNDSTPTFIGTVTDDRLRIVSDPIADTFGTGNNQPDLTGISAEFSTLAQANVTTDPSDVPTLAVALQFLNPVSLPSATSGEPGVFGFVDLDTDQDRDTGGVAWFQDLNGNRAFAATATITPPTAAEGPLRFGAQSGDPDEPVVPVPGNWFVAAVQDRTDFGIYDPVNGFWHRDLDGSATLDPGESSAFTGVPGRIPLVGNFFESISPLDNGRDERGEYDADPLSLTFGSFFLDINGNDTFDGNETFTFVKPPSDPPEFQEDIPVVGDWNGNGIDDIGVYRPSGIFPDNRPPLFPGAGLFFIDANGSCIDNSAVTSCFELSEDRNGDGAFTPGFPPIGEDSNLNGILDLNDGPFPFGATGDRPAIGDWNASGADKVGVYRPSISSFSLDLNGNKVAAAGEGPFTFGLVGDQGIIGDWDGDGTDQIGVFRLSTRQFALDLDANRVLTANEAGLFAGSAGTIPIVGNFFEDVDMTDDGIQEVGTFLAQNASAQSSLGALPVSGLGTEFLIDLGSEIFHPGFVDVIDAVTGVKVDFDIVTTGIQGTPVTLFPDNRGILVKVPLDFIGETGDGNVNLGAVIGTQTQFTDEAPENILSISSEALLVSLDSNANGLFDNGTVVTMGFGRFTVTVSGDTLEDGVYDGVGTNFPQLSFRAIDSGGNTSLRTRSIRVDTVGPQIANVLLITGGTAVPASTALLSTQPDKIEIRLFTEDADNDGQLDPGEDSNSNGILDTGRLNRATALNLSNYELITADGIDRSSFLSSVAYNDGSGLGSDCDPGDPGEDTNCNGVLDFGEDLDPDGSGPQQPNGTLDTGDLVPLDTIRLRTGPFMPSGVYKLIVDGTIGLGDSFSVEDIAGNSLDGEFFGAFPSGNGTSGGDFELSFTLDAGPPRLLSLTAISPGPDGTIGNSDDVFGPVVRQFFDPEASNGQDAPEPPEAFEAVFSQPLNPATVTTGSVVLTRSGDDGTFNDGNEDVITLRAGSPFILSPDGQVLQIFIDSVDLPLPPDYYRITFVGGDPNFVPPSVVGTNVNVSQDNDPTTAGYDGNVSIDVDPQGSLNLVAAYQDPLVVEARFSVDGGGTWLASSPLGLTVSGSSFAMSRDPSVAYRGSGVVYVSYEVNNGGDPNTGGTLDDNGIFVARSDDSGASFSQVRAATLNVDPGADVYDDKPDLAVDKGTGASNTGNTYVAWTRNVFGPSEHQEINVLHSEDQGLTFVGDPASVTPQAPLRVDDAASSSGGVYNASLTIADNSGAGGVYVMNPNAAFTFTDISGFGTAALQGVDDGFVNAPIAFPFTFFGTTYMDIFMSSNGLMTFGNGNPSFFNSNLLTSFNPFEASIAPFWDDLQFFAGTGTDRLYFATVDPTPALPLIGDRQFIAQWNDVGGFFQSPSQMTFEVVLFETTNVIEFRYLDVDSGDFRAFGGGATVGIRNTNPPAPANGEVVQYSFNQPRLSDGQTIRFTPSPTSNAVFAAWEDWGRGTIGSTPPSSTSTIKFDSSPDPGVTFGTDVVVTTTRVNGFFDPTNPTCNDDSTEFLRPYCYIIPAQPDRGISATPTLELDRSGEIFGTAPRLYLVYTDQGDEDTNNNGFDPGTEDTNGNGINDFLHDNTDILLRFSDDGGVTWSSAVQVNDDTTRTSQFFPSISVDASSGEVSISWYDARLDPANQSVDVFYTVAVPDPVTGAVGFPQPNLRITDVSSDEARMGRNQQFNLGDQTGIVALNGIAHPAWTDTRLGLGNEEIFTATVNVTELLFTGALPAHLEDVAGNFFDGESLGYRQSDVGLPTGDGVEGGDYVAGFIVAGDILFAQSDFERDPLVLSDGRSASPFQTIQEALCRVDSTAVVPACPFQAAGLTALVRPVVVNVRSGNGVPYVIQAPPGNLDGTVTIPGFTTVVVEAGTNFKMRAANIDVGGADALAGRGAALQLRGDPIKPEGTIVVTSVKQDLIAGDTNGDGANSVPQAGDWGGIVFRGVSDDVLSLINNAAIEFGGGPVPRALGPRWDSIYLDTAAPSVVNTVMAQNGAPVFPTDAQFAISANFNSFIDSTVATPAQVGHTSGMRGPLIRNMTLRDNSGNGLWVRPNPITGAADLQTGARAWWDDPVVHVMTAPTTVASNSRLTIRSSQIQSDRTELVVKGRFARLEILSGGEFFVGTSRDGDPDVVFTSWFDDTEGFFDSGFDTNNDGFAGVDTGAVSPVPGDWAGITFQGAQFALDASLLPNTETVAVVDEMTTKFAGGSIALAGGLAIRAIPPRGNGLQILGPGFYQVTRSTWVDTRDTAITVDPDVLRPDNPNTCPDPVTCLEVTGPGEPFVEDPLFRDNQFENPSGRQINGMEIGFFGDGGPVGGFGLRPGNPAPVWQNTHGLWNDTDMPHVLARTLLTNGGIPFVLPPDEFPPIPGSFLGLQEFFSDFFEADLAFASASSIHRIDFESSGTGAFFPAIPDVGNGVLDPGEDTNGNMILDPGEDVLVGDCVPDRFGTALTGLEWQNLGVTFSTPTLAGLAADTQGRDPIDEDAFSTRPPNALTSQNTGVMPLDLTPPAPPCTATPELGHALTTGSTSNDGTLDINFPSNVYAVGFWVVGSNITNGLEDIRVEDVLGNVLTFQFTATSTPFEMRANLIKSEPQFFNGEISDNFFYGVVSQLPIRRVRINENGGLETSGTATLRDAIGIDDLVFSTDPSVLGIPFIQPVSLTLQSTAPGTKLLTPFNEVYETVASGESLVVKLGNLGRGFGSSIDVAPGASEFDALSPAGRTNVGAGFQIGMDDGIDNEDAESQALADFGTNTAFRIIGVPAIEATGQPASPVILTSILDDSVTPTGVNPDTDGQGLAVPGSTTGPAPGDWGDIFIGARAADDPDRQQVPDDPRDPTQGSVIINADIRYGSRVRLQSRSFGGLGPGFANGLPGLVFEEPFAHIVVAHSQVSNMRDFGIWSHNGIIRNGFDADAMDPWIFNNTVAFQPGLNNPTSPNANVPMRGIRLQRPPNPPPRPFRSITAGVVMNNTVFGTEAAIVFDGVQLCYVAPIRCPMAMNNLLASNQSESAGFEFANYHFNLSFGSGILGNPDVNFQVNAPDGTRPWSAASLFVDEQSLDLRLVPRSSNDEPNPAVDAALSELSGFSVHADVIQDVIVRLPVEGSPMGPTKDFAGSLRIDDVRVPNIGAGAKPFFDIGSVESRDFGAPVVTNLELLVGSNLVSVGPGVPGAAVADSPRKLIATFSEDLDPGTLDSTSFVIRTSSGAPIPVASVTFLPGLNPDTGAENTAVLVPATVLPEDVYTVTIVGIGSNAITDLDGVRLDGEFRSRGYPSGDGFPGGNFQASFAVQVPPRVSNMVARSSTDSTSLDSAFPPGSGFVLATPPSSVEATFTEIVNIPGTAFRLTAAGPDRIFGSTDDFLVGGNVTFNLATLTATFVPTNPAALPTDTFYQVVLDGTGSNAITDSSGILLDGENNEPVTSISGNGVAGGDWVGFFRVGSVVTVEEQTIFVDVANDTGIENGTKLFPFNTIQEGLDSTDDQRKIVQVLPGTYFENVRFNNLLHNGVSLVSRDGDRVTRIVVAQNEDSNCNGIRDPGELDLDGDGELDQACNPGSVGTSNLPVPVDATKPAIDIDRALNVAIEGFQITTSGLPLFTPPGETQPRGGIGVRINASNAVIRRNTIFDNRTGVLIDLGFPGSNPRIENNVIWANNGPGVEVRGRVDVPAEIVNNTIVFNVDGIRLVDTGTGIPLIANIFNNIIVGSTGAGIRSVTTAGAIIDFNDVFQNLGGQYVSVATLGTHNISADPLFLGPVQPTGGRPDPLLADWRLGSFSPAIDIALGNEDVNGNGILDFGEDQNANGRLDAPPTLDHDGNARFDDPNVFDFATGLNAGKGVPDFVDMGAFERLSESSGVPGSSTGSRISSVTAVRALDSVLASGDYTLSATEPEDTHDRSRDRWRDDLDSVLEDETPKKHKMSSLLKKRLRRGF